MFHEVVTSNRIELIARCGPPSWTIRSAEHPHEESTMDGIQLRFTNSRSVVSLILIGLLSMTIGGCGSGGDSPPAASPASSPVASPAEGLWTGSTATSRTIVGAVLDDGTYYFFYSEQAAPNLIGGLVQGDSTANNGIFTSDNAKDFDFVGGGIQSGTIAANYTEHQSLNGPALSAGTGAFTTTFDPAYDTPPGLASLNGAYTGQSGNPENGGVDPTTLTVDSIGGLSGIANSCSFSGTMTPRVRGNIFDLSVTFTGAPPCLHAGETLAGIAYLDEPNKHLLAAVLTSTRTDVVLFTGIRP
jgi:hypothetical protein